MTSREPRPSERTRIGRGIYDYWEVSRIIGRDPETVARWTTEGPESLLNPEYGTAFSFLDLVSLNVISELRRRGVRSSDIARGGRFLAVKLGTGHPFAHQSLGTVGASFFVNLDSWIDAGRGGQAAFDEVIGPLIRPIEYGEDGMARMWHVADGVSIDPRVQAGEPCVDGTRIPTRVLASRIADGLQQSDVAWEYELEPAQVRAAAEYEQSLKAA